MLFNIFSPFLRETESWENNSVCSKRYVLSPMLSGHLLGNRKQAELGMRVERRETLVP